MDNAIENYWKIRMESLKAALESNNFEAFITESAAAAKQMVLEDIIPQLNARSISWGGSMTLMDTGLYDALKNASDMEIIDTADRSVPPEEFIERRRQSLLVDLFFMGTNAITETGQLVNLDMLGNRVAALTFGPKNVIVLVGRNKIVGELEDAFERIKAYAAPVNAMRLDMKTPCAKTGICEECKAPARICNTWTLTEKSFPKGRVKIVLINEDLGL
ncbi:lactate utilization protein [Thermodesulfobacteriota bacterium]